MTEVWLSEVEQSAFPGVLGPSVKAPASPLGSAPASALFKCLCNEPIFDFS